MLLKKHPQNDTKCIYKTFLKVETEIKHGRVLRTEYLNTTLSLTLSQCIAPVCTSKIQTSVPSDCVHTNGEKQNTHDHNLQQSFLFVLRQKQVIKGTCWSGSQHTVRISK